MRGFFCYAITASIILIGCSEKTTEQTDSNYTIVKPGSGLSLLDQSTRINLVGYGSNVTADTSPLAVSAVVGRWDTPYPNPITGYPAPGLEPLGVSNLWIVVDVYQPGWASFDYIFKSYDVGINDWFEVKMSKGVFGERISLIPQSGSPEFKKGTFWTTRGTKLVDLTPYVGNQVMFQFNVMQDGWGDQTAVEIINFAVGDPCPVRPLMKLETAEGLNFERTNGAAVVMSKVSEKLQTQISCLQDKVRDSNGSSVVTSGWRPPEYQVHLLDVWEKRQLMQDNNDDACSERKNAIEEEWNKHALVHEPAGPDSKHCTGQAVDLSISNIPATFNIDDNAEDCGIYRPLSRDRVHFVSIQN